MYLIEHEPPLLRPVSISDVNCIANQTLPYAKLLRSHVL
jgi:hypothetical protein